MRNLVLASMLLCSTSVFAQTTDAYVTDSTGTPVRSGSGLCVHTGYWTPADSLPGCDGLTQVVTVAKPAPAEVVVPVQPTLAVAQPAPVSIVIPANVLFGFGKHALTAEGKKGLSDIFVKHPVSTIESVAIVGHTDRIGTEKSNQKLSERRANAVASFLVGAGVSKNIVKAEGMGELAPVTQASDCASKKGNALRACYASDRRVEVRIQSKHAQ